MEQDTTLHPDTCQDQSCCELFESGQCDGKTPCPKSDSPR